MDQENNWIQSKNRDSGHGIQRAMFVKERPEKRNELYPCSELQSLTNIKYFSFLRLSVIKESARCRINEIAEF